MTVTAAMPVEPSTWNVLIVGAWNRAILSPDGVRRRLFQLPEGTPVELEIVVDQPGLFRVSNGPVIVIPGSGRLEVACRTPDADSLAAACLIGQRALQSLPETPVTAVGVNIRYRFTGEVPNPVLDLLRAPLDDALADAGQIVATVTNRRTVALAPGVVNLQLTQGDVGGALEFNFHRESKVSAELAEWLGRSQEFVNLSDQLAAAVGVPNVRGEVHA